MLELRPGLPSWDVPTVNKRGFGGGAAAASTLEAYRLPVLRFGCNTVITIAAALLMSGCVDTPYCETGVEIGRSYRVFILNAGDPKESCGDRLDLGPDAVFEVNVERKIEDSIWCDSRLATPTKVPQVEILSALPGGPSGGEGRLLVSRSLRVKIDGMCLGVWQVEFKVPDHGDPLRSTLPGEPPPVVIHRTFRTEAESLSACLRPSSRIAQFQSCRDDFGARLEPL